jgi:hypothetical protein
VDIIIWESLPLDVELLSRVFLGEVGGLFLKRFEFLGGWAGVR